MNPYRAQRQTRFRLPFEELLLIDISPDGQLTTCTSRTAKLSRTEVQTLLSLRPPRQEKRPVRIGRESAEILAAKNRQTLENHLRESSAKDRLVVFGSNFDPFAAANAQFHTTLQLLEALVHDSRTSICIQTASPLVLLAAPLLSGIKDRISITVLCDRYPGTLFTHPVSSLSEECLQAAESLRTLGYLVVCQLNPQTTVGSIHSYVKKVSSACDFLFIAQAYIPENLSKRIREEVIKSTPGKLLENQAELWQREIQLEQEAA